MQGDFQQPSQQESEKRVSTRDTLPRFKYHPDPLATGSVRASDTECVCCDEARGYIYVGPAYAVEEYDKEICPWCIADGRAHAELDVTFSDDAGVGGGQWDEVPEAVVAEVTCRTPGFSGWQQEQWWTHCGDAAAFIGAAGRRELETFGDEAVEAIRDSTAISDEREWRRFFAALDKDGSPRAYMFRCLRCGALGGYQDCD